MFRCQQCNRVQAPGVKPIVRVLETRDYVFPARVDAHKFYRERKVVLRDDPGGRGKQIVKEARVCAKCARSVK
jgi:hypothetical protein